MAVAMFIFFMYSFVERERYSIKNLLSHTFGDGHSARKHGCVMVSPKSERKVLSISKIIAKTANRMRKKMDRVLQKKDKLPTAINRQ